MNPGIDLSPVKPGELVAARYRVERVLGVGGMGIVMAATHLALDQPVAIKFLLPQALMHRDVVTRFAREARAAVRIRSEHVARVLDVGTLHNGAPYMVMEYLEGRDLHSELRARERLEVQEAVDYILQASEAIAEAHRLGIVHRDLKPGNLFLVEHNGVGVIKVLDFGISKFGGAGEAGSAGGMTQSASLLGSPAYMSPEQMTSARSVDPRSDIWALGVILFEFLAGRPPFMGGSIPELCMAITQQPAPSLCSVRAEVPAGLGAIVARCVEKEREKRYSGIHELARALAPYAPPRSRLSLERITAGSRTPLPAGSGIAAATTVPPSADAPGIESAEHESSTGLFTQPGWGRTASEKASRSLRLGIWAAVVVVAGAVGTFALRRLASDESTPNAGARQLPHTAAGATGTAPPPPPPATMTSAAPPVDPTLPFPTISITPVPDAPVPLASSRPAEKDSEAARNNTLPKPAGVPRKKAGAVASARSVPAAPPAPRTSEGWENER